MAAVSGWHLHRLLARFAVDVLVCHGRPEELVVLSIWVVEKRASFGGPLHVRSQPVSRPRNRLAPCGLKAKDRFDMRRRWSLPVDVPALVSFEQSSSTRPKELFSQSHGADLVRQLPSAAYPTRYKARPSSEKLKQQGLPATKYLSAVPMQLSISAIPFSPTAFERSCRPCSVSLIGFSPGYTHELCGSTCTTQHRQLLQSTLSAPVRLLQGPSKDRKSVV